MEGEAGIGKTTFLHELRRRAPGATTVVELLADRAERTRPFGPLLDALSLATVPAQLEPDRAGIASLWSGGPASDEPTPRASPLQSVPDERLRYIDGLARLLVAWAELCPLTVLVDDAHWADDATLAVIARAARSVAGVPLVIVLAARPVPRDEALAALIERSVERGACRFVLGALTPVEVAGVLEELAGGPPGPRLLRAAESAGGNPFLLGELVDSLRRHHDLVVVDGHAEAFADTTTREVSAHDAVIARMATIGPEAQQLLTVASVFEGAFSPAEMTAVLGRPAAALLPAIAATVRAGLLVDDGRELRFRHELLASAVRATMSESVVAALHLDIARALAAMGAPAPRVAGHYLRGATPGDVSAASWLRQAAAEIVRQAPATALELLERARDLLPPTSPARDEVLVELVDAAFWSGQVDRAVALATEALRRPLPRELTESLHETMARALTVLGQPAAAITHAEAIAAGGSGAWGRALTSILKVFAMDLDGALADAVAAADEAAGDPWATTLAYSVQGFVHQISGYHERAAELGAKAVAAADGSPGLAAHRLVPLVFHGLELQSCGRSDDAQVELRRGQELSEALGTVWAEPFYHYAQALVHWDAGRWDDLLAEAEAGLDFARTNDIALAAGFACAVSAAAHLFQRRAELAAQLLDEGDQLLARGGIQYGADWLVWVRALQLEASGRPSEALDLLEVAWHAAAGLKAGAALSLFGPDLVRLAVLRGRRSLADDVQRAHATTTSAGSRWSVDLESQRWRSALDGDLDALEDIRQRHLAVGRPVQALCDREAATLGAVLANRHDLARELLEGLTRDADATGSPGIADRAERGARALGLQLTPRQRAVRPVAGWGALTGTERAVARLVGEGRTNVQVADELGISRRTVESHLYRTFAKLGVRNRTELAVAIHLAPEPHSPHPDDR